MVLGNTQCSFESSFEPQTCSSFRQSAVNFLSTSLDCTYIVSDVIFGNQFPSLSFLICACCAASCFYTLDSLMVHSSPIEVLIKELKREFFKLLIIS